VGEVEYAFRAASIDLAALFAFSAHGRLIGWGLMADGRCLMPDA
jgi:hypothetical protein